MSPGIYRDMILIADQEGTFLMIGAGGRLETSIPTGALQPLAQAVSVHGDRAVFSGRRGDVVCLDLQKKSCDLGKKPRGHRRSHRYRYRCG